MAKTAEYKDPGGRHTRVYCTLLDSVAWRVLGWPSRSLFMDMRSSINGTNNGNLSATLSTLKHRGWKSAATLANALFELQALGFISKTRGGGVKHGSKVCSLYRFTDLEMFDFPKYGFVHQKATHDYLKLKTIAEAEQAIRMATSRRKEESDRTAVMVKNAKSRKESTLQKMNCNSADSEAVESFDSADAEAVAPALLQKLKQAKGSTNRAVTVAAQRSDPVSRDESVVALSASETEHLYILPSIRGGEDCGMMVSD